MIRLGILGYGNLGRALEYAANAACDIAVEGIYSNRYKNISTLSAPVFPPEELTLHKDGIDVLAVCLGSSGALPRALPRLAEDFSTVDAFDDHARIAELKKMTDAAAREHGNTSLLAFGWDPGLLSAERVLFSELIPNSAVNTFWGRGISQGHSEALRRIPGVIDALEVTVPTDEALKSGELSGTELRSEERHLRICYIYSEAGREAEIAEAIPRLDGYFKGYKTEIHFVKLERLSEMKRDMSHGARLIANGKSTVEKEEKHTLSLTLSTSSNPGLTAHIMLLGARITARLRNEKRYGAFTVLDLSLSDILGENAENVNKYL